jgi:hypothetical protein
MSTVSVLRRVGSRPARACALLVLCGISATAGAQPLPEGPIRTADGKLSVTGEVAATVGASDDLAFFNYTDYERNTLRLLRMSLAGQWKPLSRLAFVGDLRTEDLHHPEVYAAYIRARPFPKLPLDVQAGRIPLAFGSYMRNSYDSDNFLIGYPLAYQYLTSLRSDALPSGPDDLLVMRGRGWLTSFPIGNTEAAPGLPLISAFQWDTGVQVHWGSPRVNLAGAVTAGTLGQPRVRDNNGGRQLIGRAEVRPMVGLRLGGSGARGAWMADSARQQLPPELRARSYAQTALGADAEYSRDYWVIRGEMVWSRWDMPLWSIGRGEQLESLGAWIEGRYRFTPRIFAAARLDRLGFSEITGHLFNGQPTTWDAPVNRIEVGGGYYFQRNVIGRLVVQHNERDGGRIRRRTFVSGQLVYWF